MADAARDYETPEDRAARLYFLRVRPLPHVGGCLCRVCVEIRRGEVASDGVTPLRIRP